MRRFCHKIFEKDRKNVTQATPFVGYIYLKLWYHSSWKFVTMRYRFKNFIKFGLSPLNSWLFAMSILRRNIRCWLRVHFVRQVNGGYFLFFILCHDLFWNAKAYDLCICVTISGNTDDLANKGDVGALQGEKFNNILQLFEI